MERLEINLDSGKNIPLGMYVSLNENKRGKVISYDSATGKAIVVVEDSDQEFKKSEQLNS